jgi:hypothetical protein
MMNHKEARQNEHDGVGTQPNEGVEGYLKLDYIDKEIA